MRSGFGSQLRPMANARSGLVCVFHRAEKKIMFCSWVCYNTQRRGLAATTVRAGQESRRGERRACQRELCNDCQMATKKVTFM